MRDVSRQSMKYRSYLGTNVAVAVAWLLISYALVPLAINFSPFFGAGGLEIAPHFRPPIFLPFLLIGVFTSCLAIYRRKRSTLGAFYASSCARVVAFWSTRLLVGAVACDLLLSLFHSPYYWERIGPFTDVPFAVASLLALISLHAGTSKTGTAQERLARRTTAVILRVLLGYLILGQAAYANSDSTITEMLWIYMSLVFFALFVLAAIRARLRRGAPSAVLYCGASRIYLCCFLSSAAAKASLAAAIAFSL